MVKENGGKLPSELLPYNTPRKNLHFAFLPGGKDKFDNSSQTTMKETRNEDLFTMKVRFSIRLELVSSYCEQLFEACP